MKEELMELRQKMKEYGMAAYLIVSDDFHASEYVGEYFKCREYISGFSGSAGTLVITEDMAGLWTDGRYFIQAEEQLAGTGITLFRSGQPGVVDIGTFLEEKMEDYRQAVELARDAAIYSCSHSFMDTMSHFNRK